MIFMPNLFKKLDILSNKQLSKQIDEYIDVLLNIRDCINSDGDELIGLLNKSKLLKEWQDENYTY